MATASGGGSGGISGDAHPSLFKRELPPHPHKDTSAVKTGKEQEVQEIADHTHLYAAAREATNDVAGPNKSATPATRKNDQAYTTTAKIHDEKVAHKVYKRTMETPITVTQCKLLSLAPELRAQIADATVRRQIPRDVAQILLEEAGEGAEEDDTRSEAQSAHMPAAFTMAAHPPPTNQSASPQEAYLKTATNAQDSQDEVKVATESNTLHAVLPVVDGQERVEAILDPGCQIVAMSEEVCNALALAYNPTVQLNMISANVLHSCKDTYS